MGQKMGFDVSQPNTGRGSGDMEKGAEPTFSVGVTTSCPEGKGVVLCPVLVSSEMGPHRAWQNLITLYTEE